MTTPVVRLFRSTDTGAPVLSGTAGAAIGVLDVLLNGYNSGSVSSITRVGSTATVTRAGHGFAADGLTIVRIAGANEAEYNGDFQISNVTTNTFDITVSGTPATPATGTITCKAAPSDWTKPFSGTNKAVYRAPSGNRLIFRVDDSSAQYARVRVYESMTDVDTGTGPTPTDAQVSGGLYISKSEAASSAGRPWVLASDGYSFHLFQGWHSGYPLLYSFNYFGDPASEMSSDPFGTAIIAQTNYTGLPWTYADLTDINSQSGGVQAGHYMVRAYSQVGEAIGFRKLGNTVLGSAAIGAGNLTYPQPHNNSLYVSPILLVDSVVRAKLNSIWQPLHNKPIGHNNVVPANQSPIGRRLYAVGTFSSTLVAETLVDIDGPWR